MAYAEGDAKRGQGAWWEHPAVVAAVILLSAVPLLYPDIPPLVDLLGHMGRFRVQLDLADSPWLGDYYGFEWAAIGNLGVDLLLLPLTPILGLEGAVKLIVLAIPPLTVAGFLWVAREVHGRIPPTAYFAVPLAYGHPFLFGFVNYALSMALAFLAFALWLRLARLGRLRLRAWLFVPISLVVFFTHTYGWGALGLLCFSAEAVRQHDKAIGWLRSGWNAALHSLVLALPLVIMVAWRSEGHGGETGDWFNWSRKFLWLKMMFRDRWEAYDVASAAVIVLLLAEALRNPRLTFSRNLAFSGLVLVAGFVLLPRVIFGSAYADMRLVPYMAAAAVLAIRFRGATHLRLASALAVGGLLFTAVRLGTTGASLAIAADDQQAKLEALDRVPMGARVVSLVGQQCKQAWELPRDSHLGAMVIIRRHGFSNEQWVLEGLNLLTLRHVEADPFAGDPSQIVWPGDCPGAERPTVESAFDRLPRQAFDYVWLIDPPEFGASASGSAQRVWAGEDSALYRLDEARQASEAPSPGSTAAP